MTSVQDALSAAAWNIREAIEALGALPDSADKSSVLDDLDVALTGVECWEMDPQLSDGDDA